MVCIMIGSRIFNILTRHNWKVITISIPVFFLGTLSMLLPIITMVSFFFFLKKKNKNKNKIK